MNSIRIIKAARAASPGALPLELERSPPLWSPAIFFCSIDVKAGAITLPHSNYCAAPSQWLPAPLQRKAARNCDTLRSSTRVARCTRISFELGSIRVHVARFSDLAKLWPKKCLIKSKRTAPGDLPASSRGPGHSGGLRCRCCSSSGSSTSVVQFSRGRISVSLQRSPPKPWQRAGKS